MRFRSRRRSCWSEWALHCWWGGAANGVKCSADFNPSQGNHPRAFFFVESDPWRTLCRVGHVPVGHAAVLDAEGEEDVPEALRRLRVEELLGEVEREVGGEGAEFLDQG